jgi:uncharacterized membrane protein YoaK (UPF0700 family)
MNSIEPAIPSAADIPQDFRGFHGLLRVACVFSVIGGYLDAYAYLAHDHVFANAQTGNVVLLAVAASEGDWAQALRHLPPIGAFAAGVAVAKLLGVVPDKRTFRATLICEVFELAILIVLTVVGFGLPEASIVPIISFVAAVQSTSLGKVGPWSFNSSVTTGNIRDATSGLVLWLAGRDVAKNRAAAIYLGLICLAFLLGAMCGAVFTRLSARYSLAGCVVLAAVGIVLTWRERKKAILRQRRDAA